MSGTGRGRDRLVAAGWSARRAPTPAPTPTPTEGEEPEPTPGRGRLEAITVPRRHALLGLGLLAVLLIAAVSLASLAVADRKQSEAIDYGPGRVIDRFNRSVPDGLGVAETGQAWDVVEGEWSVSAGATVDRLARDGSLALIELGSADGQVRATMTGVVAGVGLVARYESPDDFLLVAFGHDGLWHVTRTRDGRLREVAVMRDAPPPTPTTTVELRLRGDTVDFFVNERYANSFSDRSSPAAVRVGMALAPGSTGRPVWNQFVASTAASLTLSTSGTVPASS